MSEEKRIHFIAIGGNIMHNLAIDSHLKGYLVTGSDDEIYDPSKSRLQSYGLLPETFGWYPEKITADLQAVIVGMHAREDNPELLKAQELGLKIYSFPEYIYEQCQHKQRVVVAGSHGKTTITSIVMHVLENNHRKFDYLVGAKVAGFEQLIRISQDAPTIILEGDEYPSAPFDATPKFMHYRHHIGLISGVSWDHLNAYPSFDSYMLAFEQFADASPKAGNLIYCKDDSLADVIGNKERADVKQIPYQMHPHKIINGKTYLIHKQKEIPVQIFGEHNMKNISAAKEICLRIGIREDNFYRVISSFKGASKRLEKVCEYNDFVFFRDFAHAPSKLAATTLAVKKQLISHKLVGCFELHTFSSLNKDFLPQYRYCFDAADRAFVYYNPDTIKAKKLPELDPQEVKAAFGHENLSVIQDVEELKAELLKINWHNKTLLMMSSGTFDHLNFKSFGDQLISQLDQGTY